VFGLALGQFRRMYDVVMMNIGIRNVHVLGCSSMMA